MIRPTYARVLAGILCLAFWAGAQATASPINVNPSRSKNDNGAITSYETYGHKLALPATNTAVTDFAAFACASKFAPDNRCDIIADKHSTTALPNSNAAVGRPLDNEHHGTVAFGISSYANMNMTAVTEQGSAISELETPLEIV